MKERYLIDVITKLISSNCFVFCLFVVQKKNLWRKKEKQDGRLEPTQTKT